MTEFGKPCVFGHCVGIRSEGSSFAFFKPVSRVGNKFGDVEFYTSTTESPILKDALSWFECCVVDMNERADHALVTGEVVDAGVHRTGDPLTLKQTGLFYGG